MPNENEMAMPDERPSVVEAVAALLEAEDRGAPLDIESWLSPHDELTRRELQDVLAGLRLLQPASPPRVEPGRVTPRTLQDFDRYTELHYVAAGGMGAIYRASDKVLGRSVALKIIHPDLAGDPNAVARFTEEARIASQLQHPHITPVYDFGLVPGKPTRPHFTMKLIVGETLSKVITECRRFPNDVKREVLLRDFIAVCGAVEYAHGRGVLHRDLKPSNVMVGEQGEIQVMDWGLSKQYGTSQGADLAGGTESQQDDANGRSQDNGSGLVRGTPAYMSPEQANGLELGPASDVFGLGAILCEILTGSPPYWGESFAEVFTKARNGALDDAFQRLTVCGEPIELADIAKRCLAPRIPDRFASASEVGGAVAAFMADRERRLREAELAKASAEARVVEEQKRRRIQLWLVATIFVTVFGGISVAVWRKWDLEQTRFVQERRRLEAFHRLSPVLAEARSLSEQHLWSEALAAARRALAVAQDDRIELKLRREATGLVKEIEAELAQAKRDEELLTRSLDMGLDETIVASPIPKRLQMSLSALLHDDEDTHTEVTTAAASSVGLFDPRFIAAFRDYGIDMSVATDEQIVAKLNGRPLETRREIASVFDLWAFADRDARRPESLTTRLCGLARSIDPDPARDELRNILAKQQIAPEVNALLAPISRWLPASDHNRLLDLCRGIDLSIAPSHTVRLMAVALLTVRENEQAIALLYSASQARPDDAGIYHTLACALIVQIPSRWEEAIPVLQTVRALRPDVGGLLAGLLARQGRFEEALHVCDSLADRRPASGWPDVFRSSVLLRQNKFQEALDACTHALERDPNVAGAYNNRAVALGRKRSFDEAEAPAREAVRREPDWGLAHGNLGLILTMKGEVAEGEAECRKAVALNPAIPESYVHLAQALLAGNKFLEAEVQARLAIQLDSKCADAHSVLGIVLFETNRYVEAEKACRAAVELAHGNGLMRSNLAIVLSKLDQLDDAEREARTAARSSPDDSQVQFQLGEVLEDCGKLNEAAKAFEFAAQLSPAEQGFHIALGSTLEKLGQQGRALTAYRKAADLPPRDGKCFFILACILQEQKEFVEAEKAYRKAIELSADSFKYSSMLASMLRELGRDADARRVLEEASGRRPKNQRQFQDLGEIFLTLQNYLKAETAYRHALRLEPKSIRAVTGLAKSLAGAGKRDEAIAALLSAEKLESKNVVEWYGYALQLESLGQWEASANACRRIIDLLKDVRDDKSNESRGWAYSTLGTCLDSLGRRKEAVAAFRNALAINPSDYWVWSMLGGTHFLSGEYEEAIAAFGEAAKLNPGDVKAHDQFGWALCLSGRFFEAANAYRRSIRLDSDNFLAHLRLAYALVQIGEFEEAVETLNGTERLAPDSADRWTLASEALRQLGHTEEALQAVDKTSSAAANSFSVAWERARVLAALGDFEGAALASDQSLKSCPESNPDFQAIATGRQTMQLLGEWSTRTAEIVAGQLKPEDIQQSRIFAVITANKGYPLASVRLYEAILAKGGDSDPRFALSPRVAAASQALLATSQPHGRESPLDDAGKAALREKARQWLVSELTALSRICRDGSAAERSHAHHDLRYLQAHPAFTSVRDTERLSDLPAEEVEAWKRFWKEVEAARVIAATNTKASPP